MSVCESCGDEELRKFCKLLAEKIGKPEKEEEICRKLDEAKTKGADKVIEELCKEYGEEAVTEVAIKVFTPEKAKEIEKEKKEKKKEEKKPKKIEVPSKIKLDLELSPLEREIIKCIKEGIDESGEISKKIRVSKADVDSTLRFLERIGMVRRVKDPNVPSYTRWKIVE